MSVAPSKSLTILILLASLSLLCGCAHEYLMTLDNGDQVLSLTKPKRQGTAYQFTGDDGVGRRIPEVRVQRVQTVALPKQADPGPAPAEPKKPRHWYLLWLA